jgi:hypothetical protein
VGRNDKNAAGAHRQLDKEPLELDNEEEDIGYDELPNR